MDIILQKQKRESDKFLILFLLVEITGLEPVTSTLPVLRSSQMG